MTYSKQTSAAERSKGPGLASTLLMGVSALAFGAIAFCSPAHAQAAQGAQTTNGSSDETIVVRGLRGSLRSAEQIKRDSAVIVDSVTAEDIGALPDRSVSETLQRIPGVTLQRTNENRDPARLASEGGGVFVRGLSWVRSETNGRDIFSAANGRTLSFEDVSSDLLGGVDVFKSPSADLIEGGIGGTVNLRTRVPFDQAGRLMAASLDYNYADLLKEGFTSGNALFSDRWQLHGVGEVGLLFSASVGNIGNRTDSIQTGRYEPRTLGVAQDGHAAGSTVFIPNALGWRRIDWRQERDSFAGALQWAPSRDLMFTLQALYAKATPQDIEHALGDTDGDLPTDSTSYHFDSQGVLTSGVLTDAHMTADTRFGDRQDTTSDVSLHFRYTPDGPWSLSGDLQHVKSTAKILSMTVFTQLGVAPGFGGVPARPDLTYSLTGDSPTWSLSDPAIQAQQSAYWWAAAMDHLEDNEAHEWASRLDAEYAFPEDGFLKSFRMGVRGTDKEALTRQTGYNWSLLSQQFWGSGGGAPVYINQTGSPPNAGLPAQAALFTYDNFFRGDVHTPGVAWFPIDELTHNTARAYSFLQSTESSGWGWVPLTSGSFAAAAPAGDNVSGGINHQNERTWAAYGMLSFESVGGTVPFDGNVGLRVVRTENAARGRLVVNGVPAGGCVGTCTDFNRALAFASAAGGDQTYANSYTNVLPSLNLRFHLSDDVQLRLAASKSMVRPNFSQMTPFANLSFDFTGTVFNPANPTPFTGTAGNPNLKPTTANNLDASVEWYFAPTGSLTFAAFYKDISNYVVIKNQFQSYTAGGQTFNFFVAQQTNADSGQLAGGEIAYTQFFDFLPGWWSGFGVQANFTYIENSGGANSAVNPFEAPQVVGAADSTLPMEGMSRTSYNITGMYEKYGISARLAYNWRERYLLTTSAANIQRPVWSEDYGQLDGSVFYSLNEHVKMGLQGTNLLNARTFLDVGGSVLAPRYSWTDTDRRIAFAVRATY